MIISIGGADNKLEGLSLKEKQKQQSLEETWALKDQPK